MSIVDGLLNQSVTSISSVSEDGFGDETLTQVYSTTICRWQERNTQTTNDKGELVAARVEAWFEPTKTIKEDYRVVKDSTTYVVVGTQKRYDLDGNYDHLQVYLV